MQSRNSKMNLKQMKQMKQMHVKPIKITIKTIFLFAICVLWNAAIPTLAEAAQDNSYERLDKLLGRGGATNEASAPASAPAKPAQANQPQNPNAPANAPTNVQVNVPPNASVNVQSAPNNNAPVTPPPIPPQSAESRTELVLPGAETPALTAETINKNPATPSIFPSKDLPSIPDTDEPEGTLHPVTLRDQAFKQLLDKVSPLTPDQILELRKNQDQSQRAIATEAHTPPRPVSSTLTIDLSPGVTPPVIRLAQGFVTTVVFVDITGQPWPISDYSLGDPKSFNIQWDKKTNTFFIQANQPYASGNLAIRLGNLDTPLTLSLVSGQKEVDYRVDLQVLARGPNAKIAVVTENLPPVIDQVLLSVLDGIPPPGSVELVVCGNYGRAWTWQNKLLYRTKDTVLSPAWKQTVSSVDGTHVYELPLTPLILISHNGKPINVELKGL